MVLLVEDCLASAEAMRLMARAAGLRLRAADSIEAARRHLAMSRPALVIVDLGLPDGDGIELLRMIAAELAPRPRSLALSADAAALADAAGIADATAVKPFPSVAAFTAAIAGLVPHLRATPAAVPPVGAAAVRQDLARARAVLAAALPAGDAAALSWGARFLRGLALQTADAELGRVAEDLRAGLDRGGHDPAAGRAALSTCERRLDPLRAL
jgi:DNA-binding response OmpR family regulator